MPGAGRGWLFGSAEFWREGKARADMVIPTL